MTIATVARAMATEMAWAVAVAAMAQLSVAPD